MMKRSMKKAIEEYYKTFGSRPNGKAEFYASDIMQIKDMSAEQAKESGNTSISEYEYNLIINALMAGYMIGCRTAKREQKQETLLETLQ